MILNIRVNCEQREKQALRSQLPQFSSVALLSTKPTDLFINRLNSSIAKTQITYEADGIETLESALEAEANRLINQQAIDIDSKLVSDFLMKIAPKRRSMLLNAAVELLRTIYVDGVYDL